MSENYGPHWKRVTLMVLPGHNRGAIELHAIGGDKEPGAGDTKYEGLEIIKDELTRLRADLAVAREALEKSSLERIEELEAALRDVSKSIPSNWCDPLLTGDSAALHGEAGTWNCQDIERLLNAIRERIANHPEHRDLITRLGEEK